MEAQQFTQEDFFPDSHSYLLTHPSRDWAQDVGSYPSWVIMPVSLAKGHLTSFPLKDAQERQMYIMAHRPLCLRLTLMTGDE